MIKLKNILIEQQDVNIPLIFGYTYDLKIKMNGQEVSIDPRTPMSDQRSIRTRVPYSSGEERLVLQPGMADTFTVEFIPIDANTLDPEKQKKLRQYYKKQLNITINKRNPFPKFNPESIPSFKLKWANPFEPKNDRYGKRKSSEKIDAYSNGKALPYDTKSNDFLLYKGQQFKLYIQPNGYAFDKISGEGIYEWIDKKTLDKLEQQGWKKSNVSMEEMLEDKSLKYFKSAAMLDSGYSGFWVGKSPTDIVYFIYEPGRSRGRGADRASYQEIYSNIHRYNNSDKMELYDGGNYFKFNGTYD